MTPEGRSLEVLPPHVCVVEDGEVAELRRDIAAAVRAAVAAAVAAERERCAKLLREKAVAAADGRMGGCPFEGSRPADWVSATYARAAAYIEGTL